MFQESLKDDSRNIEGCFNGVLSGSQRCLRNSKNFEKKVSRVFKESGKCVSRKFQCFNEVLLCNFLFAWISLQLPKQKEGLLFLELSEKTPMQVLTLNPRVVNSKVHLLTLTVI